MKNTNYLIATLFVLCSCALINAQSWTLQPSGTNQKLNSIYAVGSSTVYTVGNAGTARKTISGGTLWQPHNLGGTTENQNSIRFINQTIGNTTGQFQNMMQTTNGGTSWTNIGGGVTELYDGYFTSSSSGWVVGDIESGFGFLYNLFTLNFVMSPINANKALYGIYFANSTTGWVVGDAGLIMKTTNFGNSWSQQNSTISTRLNKVMFLDANNGIIVGNAGLILQTTNGGSSWIAQTNGTANLNAVYYADQLNIWICGDNGTLLHSGNSGASWSLETSNTTQNLNGIHGIGTTNVWACGNNGTILSRGQCTAAPAPPSLISGAGIVCEGATRIYTVSSVAGATSYSWTLTGGWSGTSSTHTISITAGTSPGTITVSAENSCGVSAAVQLNVNTSPNPTVTINSSNPVLCLGSTATLSAGGADLYTWQPGNQSGQNISISPTVTTSYTVLGAYTNQLGCSSQKNLTQVVDACTSIDRYPDHTISFRIYPNPNSGNFHIEAPYGTTLCVLNSLCQVVARFHVEAGTNTLQLNELDSGIYYVLANNQGLSKALKLIKE